MKFTLIPYPGGSADVRVVGGTVVAQFLPPDTYPLENLRLEAQRLMFEAPETAAERDRLLAEVQELRDALEACALTLSGCFETVSVKKSYSKARAVLAKTKPSA